MPYCVSFTSSTVQLGNIAKLRSRTYHVFNVLVIAAAFCDPNHGGAGVSEHPGPTSTPLSSQVTAACSDQGEGQGRSTLERTSGRSGLPELKCEPSHHPTRTTHPSTLRPVPCSPPHPVSREGGVRGGGGVVKGGGG
jgi:hypothetical protein